MAAVIVFYLFPVVSEIFAIVTDVFPVLAYIPAVLAHIAAVGYPVVFVFIIAAIADDNLAFAAPVIGVFGTVNIVAYPWAAFVYYYFITIVHIVAAIPGWQCSAVYPYIVLYVNVLVGGDIIVSINIRHIVIVGVVVPNRAPLGLAANIYI